MDYLKLMRRRTDRVTIGRIVEHQNGRSREKVLAIDVLPGPKEWRARRTWPDDDIVTGDLRVVVKDQGLDGLKVYDIPENILGNSTQTDRLDGISERKSNLTAIDDICLLGICPVGVTRRLRCVGRINTGSDSVGLGVSPLDSGC